MLLQHAQTAVEGTLQTTVTGTVSTVTAKSSTIQNHLAVTSMSSSVSTALSDATN